MPAWETYGLRYGGADFHPGRFTLGCKQIQRKLAVMVTDGAKRTTSSPKNRDPIQKSPNRTPSSLRLHLEILFIKVMNRISVKGQSWQCGPTLTPVIQGADTVEGIACPSDPRSSVVWGFKGSHGKQVLGGGNRQSVAQKTCYDEKNGFAFPLLWRGYRGPLLEPGLGAGHDSERLVARTFANGVRPGSAQRELPSHGLTTCRIGQRGRVHRVLGGRDLGGLIPGGSS